VLSTNANIREAVKMRHGHCTLTADEAGRVLDRLCSETPTGVLQELYALSLGHFVARSVMAEAAAEERLDPDRLSFVGCLQILRCRMPECPEVGSASFTAWYRGLLAEVRQERTDDVRRNRINPRVIKVKRSKFKKKRPVPPLKKTFVESVVMLC
jgi:hypothetical protein